IKKQLNNNWFISSHEKPLEETLGVMLLHRSTRQVALTEIGAAYYREAQNILFAVDQANGVIVAAKQEPVGILRIKSVRYFADYCIFPRLTEYMNLYPQVKVDLQIAEHIPHLLEEDLDIVFGMSAQVASNSVQKKITSTRYVFCASPSYIREHGIPEHPIELLKHKYITHTMRSPNDAWIFPTGETIYLTPVLYLNDAASMLECAVNGLGIVSLHHYQVADALASGDLVEVLAEYRMPKIPVFLYYHPGRYMQPKVKTWVDFMSTNIPDEI
uniref:LysR family transcriptional regulator n=1 Tax=uncultured Legionella sp. TaxID=210934 RepID=UPI00261F3DBB